MSPADFLKYKNWVVIGDVTNSSKYAYSILNALKEHGLNASGLHPKDESGLIYKSLKEVPYSIEVIDLCINPKYGMEFIKEAKSMGINNILIQPGAESPEIIRFAEENKMNAIEGCALTALSDFKK
ncbi:MAG: CoA-binding protein [Bacillota bacterium]|nr:CoA-binding protein [Bacillota bacterium]